MQQGAHTSTCGMTETAMAVQSSTASMVPAWLEDAELVGAFGFLLHKLYGVVHLPSHGPPTMTASVQRCEMSADFQKALSRRCP